jgi:hypothetical protein
MHRHALAWSDGCAELVSQHASYLAADALADGLADSFSNDSNSHENPNAAAD